MYSTEPTLFVPIITQHLRDLCGLPPERATTISSCLKNYFSSASQRKTVVKKIDFKSFIRCFDLSSKVGNVLLSSNRPVDSLSSVTSGNGGVGDGAGGAGSGIGGVGGGVGDSLKVTRSFSRSFSTHPVKLTLKETLSASTLLDVG